MGDRTYATHKSASTGEGTPIIDVFHIGQGDTLPYYPIQVRDANGPIDLSDVQYVYFRMAPITYGANGSVVAGGMVVSGQAFITDISQGKVEYRWGIYDTQTVGEYAVAFTFYTESSQQYTLPRNMLAKVIVEDRYATSPGG